MTRKNKNSSNNSKKSARSARDNESHEAAANTGRLKNLVTCKYCGIHWEKGVIYEIENHLASHCLQVPRNILRHYINLVEEKDKEPEIRKKRKSNSGV
ncbi:hypothetical protein RCL_jg12490.t1 [Rhizophagus clarus]|uniref:Uncharacterized protein n=1 Tax=Rhizophagus clarus TaxID=94130 RepID=A0A8H3KZ74_9GLOM|nr:hypothetical protein RCL_jg12490.t1 [Rhizophagus clarus]